MVAFEYNNDWHVCPYATIKEINGVACFVYNTHEDGKCIIKFKKRVYKPFTVQITEGKYLVTFQ
jgi:hypothetical protein